MKYHTTTLFLVLVLFISFSIFLYDLRREPMFFLRCRSSDDTCLAWSWYHNDATMDDKSNVWIVVEDLYYQSDKWKHILLSVGCPCFLLLFNMWPRYTISFSLVWNGNLWIRIRWRAFLLITGFGERKMKKRGFFSLLSRTRKGINSVRNGRMH